MPWFKVDDSFYDHPKVFDAPDCVVALWVRAGSWSARNLTDGFVPAKMPARFCDDPKTAVRELINRGLWKRTRGGYLFHEWDADGDGTPRNPTRSELTAMRSRQSSGGAIGNHRRWHIEKGKHVPTCPYCQREQFSGSDRSTDWGSDTPTESDPNRPTPIPSQGGGYLGRGSYVGQRARENPPPPQHSLGPRPDDRCDQHRHEREPPPCGRCADARRAAQQWDQTNTKQRKQWSAQLEAAQADPANECPHGTPGGLVIHPDTGLSACCATCRNEQRDTG